MKAKFDLMRNIHLADLFGTVGVYVLWSDRDALKPQYVGEGEMLKRLASHADWLEPPCDGYLACLGDWDDAKAKAKAEMVEAALLAVCDDTLRWPEENSKSGSHKHIRKLLESHRTLRVSIGGYDPLRNPAQPNRLSGHRTVKFMHDGLGPSLSWHDWRKLRGA